MKNVFASISAICSEGGFIAIPFGQAITGGASMGLPSELSALRLIRSINEQTAAISPISPLERLCTWIKTMSVGELMTITPEGISPVQWGPTRAKSRASLPVLRIVGIWAQPSIT